MGSVKNKHAPVFHGRGIYRRYENRVLYMRRHALARYYRQRLLILAELGNKCGKCGATQQLQVVKKPDALLPFRINELFHMARERLPYHLKECDLLCIPHANEVKFGHRKPTHGLYYSSISLQCHCNECEEFRADFALRRREDRRRKKSDQHSC